MEEDLGSLLLTLISVPVCSPSNRLMFCHYWEMVLPSPFVLLQVSPVPGACMASHLSVCVHHVEPSLACGKLQTNYTWKEGGKAFSLWKIAPDMHPAILGLIEAFTWSRVGPINSLCCAITDCKLLVNPTTSLHVHLSLSSAPPCDWWWWMCACWQHQVSHPWEFRAEAATMYVVQLAPA